jgi:hypothetical protein
MTYLQRNPPTSKSPDRKFDVDMDDTRVEKLNTVETQYEINPVIDRRVTRKFDLHIPPWLFGIWLLTFIDRSSIGNAEIDGLTKDLELTGKKFNVALVVFTFLTKPLMFRLIGWSSTFRLGAIYLFFSSTRTLPLDSF